MEKEQPSYYAVIPARVRYADIMPNAKLLYGEITALANSKGYCWASNEHFAKLYNVSEKQVSLWLKQLIEHKFIETEIIKNQSGSLRKCYVLEERAVRTLRKGFADYQKVTGTLPKGNVPNRVGTLPKGNVNNKLNNKKNTVINNLEENRKGTYSPAKERLRQWFKERDIKKAECG